MLLDVLVASCRARHDAFVGAPPLGELLERAGLSRRGDEVADADFDWATLAEARHQDYVVDLAERYDLDIEAAEHLSVLARTALSDDPAGDGKDVTACIAALRHPDATAAFLEPKVGRNEKNARNLVALAGVVIDASGSGPPAGSHFVLARAAEIEGDALAHAREVDETLRIDPSFAPALEDRAWVRADRGEVRAAVADLEQVVDDDHPRLLVLDRYSAPGPMTAGRNEHCPCGSGRKYKVCCGRANGYRLVDRAPFLFEKAMWFASRPAQRDDVMAMIEEAFEDSEIDLSYVPEEVFLTDPVLLHVALFAAGLMLRFDDERGVLLPDDEQALVANWADATLRTLRVEHVEQLAITVTDLVTGERLTFGHHGLDDSVGPSRVIIAAPLFDGERLSLLAWLTIADEHVDEVVSSGSIPSIVRALALARRDAVAKTLIDLQASRVERLAWLFPDAEPMDRERWTVSELVEGEHPELVAAIEAGREHVKIAGDHEINPTLHMAIHEIVAEQILGDEPPEMWTTAIRLANVGYDRHEILHMLGSTVSDQVFDILGGSDRHDGEEQIAQLLALPATWEMARRAHGVPHRGARQHGRHPRR
jgi:hypothetical protein